MSVDSTRTCSKICLTFLRIMNRLLMNLVSVKGHLNHERSKTSEKRLKSINEYCIDYRMKQKSECTRDGTNKKKKEKKGCK